ncbi:MAG: bifunctional folylpolyglutamate synthase/dihydrofolate synthase, partial [Actinomycetes bacterium]
MSGDWTSSEATEFLLSRELFGIKPGLERMRLLAQELGNPQDRLRTIHVVGTNGKSSTTRYAAALLCQMGVPAGAYISPHLIDFNQRVLLPSVTGGIPTEVSAQQFAAAVERVASAEQRVAPKLPEGDVVTQFELVTAAALLLISESGAEVAVLEAGLGGRLDATNILNDGGVVALTGISLDHTRWLGESVEQIAAEKLAVLRTGGKLAVG